MKLDENYRIETDAYNYTLVYECKKFDQLKKKEIHSKAEWHYPELKHALVKYMNESLKTCESIKEVFLKIDELEKKIASHF
jgi:hypothetical protein